MINLIEKFSNLSIEVKENEPLKNHTTFKIGGPAKYFCLLNKIQQIKPILQIAKDNQLKVFIIGGGSNLLVSDNGFDGLVLKFNFKQIEILGNRISVSADFPLGQLVTQTINNHLCGLEFATGIPGTIGGAVVGNAGAYGGELADLIDKIEVLNDKLEFQELKKADLKFRYRYSILKDNHFTVIKVYLLLSNCDSQKSIEEMKRIALDRYKKHPQEPSAGSTFKNIILTDEVKKKLEQKDIKIPEASLLYQKIPVALLIESLGLKGKTIGGAQISNKHANHLINIGNATADDVVQLMSLVKMKVRDELGIQLEEELRYVGF